MKIVEMKKKDSKDYIELFVSVFNREPWNDRWTEDSAGARIHNMMDTNTFVGKALVENGILVGLIWGQKEYFYDGVHFQIQEFCVKTELQGKGYGTKLLEALQDSLKADGVSHIYLITSIGERTEGYYLRKEFKTSGNMVIMSKSI